MTIDKYTGKRSLTASQRNWIGVFIYTAIFISGLLALSYNTIQAGL